MQFPLLKSSFSKTWWVWALCLPLLASAHPGGLDAHGCHTNHKTGAYHCHGSNSSNPSSKASAGPASGNLVGVASVIDGDTIEIHGQRIRLYGIDAPESTQICRLHGTAWRCGRDAAMHLADFIGKRTVHCDAKDRDRYGRVVAICTVGGTEINAWMVSHGDAVAYRQYGGNHYDQEEAKARQENKGIWGSSFEMPWDWRKSGQ